MEFNDVLNRRYSCRAFAARGVEHEKVERILEVGRMAPTAVNKQPVHIWVVSRPETLEAIKRHGRSGQNQHGVDVYANVENCGDIAAFIQLPIDSAKG